MALTDLLPQMNQGYDDREPLLGLHDEEEDEREQIYGRKNVQASKLVSIFNLTHTILGSGILGLPGTLANAGTVFAPMLIIFGALAAAGGLYLLGIVQRGTQSATYHELALQAHWLAPWFVNLAVVLKCFGVSCSYMVIVGQLVPLSFQRFELGHPILEDRHLWQGLAMAVVLLCCFLKDLKSLRYFSLAALIAILIFVGFVFIYFIAADQGHAPKSISTPMFSFSISTLLVLPTITYSFTCHQNFPTIMHEMAKKTPDAQNAVIFYSILTCCALFLLTALTGFFTFPDTIKGSANILDNYPASNIPANLVRIAISLSCVFCVPFQIHPARVCTINLLRMILPKPLFTRLKPYMRFLVVFVLCMGVFVVTYFVVDLGLIFAIVGSTGSSLICFGIPAYFYFRITTSYMTRTRATTLLAASLALLTPIMLGCGLFAVIFTAD
eukprot:m.236932 g.236932  ORF g.236932 m.236932 type:complete len:441 (-) comp20841_c0_seq1:59-1381(-)